MSSRSSKTDAVSPLPERVAVGRIRRPVGLRGGVVIELLTDNPGRFEPGAELRLERPGGRSETVRVHFSRPHKSGLVVEFDGYGNREAAESLRGSELAIARSEVPPADEGVYYHFELIGCRCVDAELGELGTVEALREDGGGELLVVERQGRRLLVPFVRAIIRTVDIEDRRIDLVLPAGLYETCESGS